MSLKDTTLTAHALAAYHQQLEHEAEKEAGHLAKRGEAARMAFPKMFGFHGDIALWAGGAVLVTKDELQLLAVFEVRRGVGESLSCFQLWGTCPDCNADCYSKRIHDLSSLGKQIENIKPGWQHKCALVHSPTVGEALLEALQNYVEEMLDE